MAQADRTGVHASIEEVARAEKINPSDVGWLLRLTLLAPEIIEVILDGHQLVGVTVAGLLTPFPVVWAERDIAPAGRRRPELASLHRGNEPQAEP